MKVAIVDDITECRKRIKGHLSSYLVRHCSGVIPTVDEFSCAEQFLSRFRPDSYDLIFMDYYMNGIDGLTAARSVRELDTTVPLVFITSNPDHAIDGYQVRASGYLLKPIEYDAFEQALSPIQIGKILDREFIEISGKQILLHDIVYCDQDRHYAQLHTASHGTIRFRMSFRKLQPILSHYPWFLPCYRSCTVNLKHVKELRELEFLMDTGERVLFRKKDQAAVERRYSRFLFHQAREAI